MGKTLYSNFSEITITQEDIMHIVQNWVHTQKTPTPYSEIIKQMVDNGATKITVVVALGKLVGLGYLRKTNVGANQINKSFYIQLRSI